MKTVGPVLRLTLPEPPSANRYWRVGGGRIYTSKAAIAYKAAVVGVITGRHINTMPFPEGPIALTIIWRRKIKSGDLDNRLKQVLDALQGLIYTNDSQIVELHAYRLDAPPKGTVELFISTTINRTTTP